MKKPILLLFFLSFFVCAFAQNGVKETIHLHNGTVVSGHIVEIVPGKTYTIVTADGNKFVFEQKDIAKITRTFDEGSKSTPKSRSGGGESIYTPGYQGFGGIGFGAGMGALGVNMFKLDIINGKRFDENLFAGIGVGLRQPMEDDLQAYIPVYANVAYNLTPGEKVTPVAALSVGAAFDTEQGLNNGGLLINPSVGVNISAIPNMALHASLGYDVMHMQFYVLRAVGTPDVYVTRKTRFTEAFVINLGLVF